MKKINPLFEREFVLALKQTLKERAIETYPTEADRFNRILIDKNNLKEIKKEILKKGVSCETHHIIEELNTLLKKGVISFKESTLGKIVFAIDLILLEEVY
uniref:Uncharacterized protein n=1 Tax=candidate division CPR3 bacterium TaxID=2268181 RepID=A0A7C4QWV4_UNCC3